ncbi:MAG: hypothetical protein H6988_09265 [Pseudomonadales bacterium]|nr:hypothetical protein [Anaerolineales bacterium]MCB8918598.1 hypothetical protein [Ardenticatenaceae bacterium]MCP5190564.1 hypothetical protein [Pseudomonadales bacterium]
MRRYLVVLLLILLGTTALAQAQTPEPVPAGATPATAIISELPPSMVDGPWIPFELEPIDVSELPSALQANAAADECEAATYSNLPFGDVSLTNSATTAPTDPILPCLFGAPTSAQGYRTVWYKFVPLESGVINISTAFNPSTFSYQDSYDTVLALHKATDLLGTCSALSLLACNDDASGLQSEIRTFVRQWETYYIEVADYNFAVNGDATLRLAVSFSPGESFWNIEEQAYQNWEKPRSRHIVLNVHAGPDFDFLYVIAGQTYVNGNPLRDGRVDRYHVQSGTWEEMTPMPGFGYSNTTGALVNGRIYVPAGYVGNNSAYDGRQWVYDVGLNAWFENQNPAPWNLLDGQPYAWSVAVPLTVGQTSGYFLTGGVLPQDNNPTFEPVDHLLFFAPSADGTSGTWNLNLAPMSRARYSHAAAAITRQTQFGPDEQVCVAGGITRESNIYRSLAHAECYSNISGTWTDIAPMNFNRYNGGSAVGPDGRWYVFGGKTVVRVNNVDVIVPLDLTERYDPESGVWEVLDSRYDVRNPSRDWPRGDFAGNTLWIFGGETLNTQTGTIGVVPIIQSLLVPSLNMALPVISGGRPDGIEPNDTLDDAYPIAFYQPQYHDFASPEDFFDFFSFTVTTATAVSARLTNIPAGSNYDIYLFNRSKFLVGSSTNIGNLDENAISFVLTPGTYYAMVVRVSPDPTTDQYRIEIVPQ